MAKYSEEIFIEVCNRLARGESLREIAIDDNMPAPSTVLDWVGRSPANAERYTRAREAQGDDQFERVCQIADKVERGEIDPQSARVAIDARKWIAGKLRPKVYGDKIDLSSSDGTMSPPKEIRLNIIAPVKKSD